MSEEEKRQGILDGFQGFKIQRYTRQQIGYCAPDGANWVKFEDHELVVREQQDLLNEEVRLKRALAGELQERSKANSGDRRFEAARAALTGIIVRMTPGDTSKEAAVAAVGLADALLAELDKPREEPGIQHEDD